jgi:hypothetical protein
MSNYPDGVSGLEYEIAGPDSEWEEEIECTNDNFQYVMISPYAYKYISDVARKYSRTNTLKDVQDNLYKYLSHINSALSSPGITDEIQYTKCGYVGEVIKQSYRKQVWWSCPQCGKDYEETIEPYRDDY